MLTTEVIDDFKQFTSVPIHGGLKVLMHPRASLKQNRDVCLNKSTSGDVRQDKEPMRRKTGVFAIYGQKDPCVILSENFNSQPAKIFRSAKLKGNFVHRETIKMVNVEVSIPVGKLSSFLNRPIPYPRTFSYYTSNRAKTVISG